MHDELVVDVAKIVAVRHTRGVFRCLATAFDPTARRRILHFDPQPTRCLCSTPMLQNRSLSMFLPGRRVARRGRVLVADEPADAGHQDRRPCRAACPIDHLSSWPRSPSRAISSTASSPPFMPPDPRRRRHDKKHRSDHAQQTCRCSPDRARAGRACRDRHADGSLRLRSPRHGARVEQSWCGAP